MRFECFIGGNLFSVFKVLVVCVIDRFMDNNSTLKKL